MAAPQRRNASRGRGCRRILCARCFAARRNDLVGIYFSTSTGTAPEVKLRLLGIASLTGLESEYFARIGDCPLQAAARNGHTPTTSRPGTLVAPKLRFEVETLYLPVGSLSAFTARHAEQSPGWRSSNPAAKRENPIQPFGLYGGFDALSNRERSTRLRYRSLRAAFDQSGEAAQVPRCARQQVQLPTNT